MAKILLKSGDYVAVGFADSDGGFEVHFDTANHPNAIILKETAGLPGNVKGGANEILYHEQFISLQETDLPADMYALDIGKFNLLNSIRDRLADESKPLSGDERRDLAHQLTLVVDDAELSNLADLKS